MANVLTIGISNSTIRICDITNSNKGVVINKVAMIKVPEGTVDDGIIVDTDTMATTITKELNLQGIVTKQVIFVLSSSRIASKDVITPVLKGQKLDSMIAANASDYFPIDIENYVIANKVICPVMSEGNKQLRVSACAAPKDMVSSYYELAGKMGLTIKSLEYYGNAAISLLGKQIGQEVSVVVEIEDESTTVNIFNNGIIELQRILPYGKMSVVQTVADVKGISYDEAEVILAKERLIHSTFDGDEVTDSLRYMINNIVRVVDYYSSRGSKLSVEKAYLTGCSIEMLGIEDLFASEFNFSVEQINEFKYVSISPNLILEQKSISKFIGCAGAAINPMNFVMEELIESESGNSKFRYGIIGLVAAVVLGIILILVPSIRYLFNKSDLDDVNERIDKIRSVEKVMDKYYDANDRYRDFAGFKVLTEGPGDYLLTYIKRLESYMPSDISIKQLNVSDGVVTINGIASSKQAIAGFSKRFREMNGISSVLVSSITESKDEYGIVTCTFSMTMMYDKQIAQDDTETGSDNGQSAQEE